MYDATRLLVACTGDSETCRTPHLTADLLTALRDTETSLRSVTVLNGTYMADLVVNGSPVEVRGVDASEGTFSVRYKEKFAVAFCRRTTSVPVSVAGAPLLPLLADKYAQGTRLTDLGADVQWDTATYLEVAPIVDAIRMLIPPSSYS